MNLITTFSPIKNALQCSKSCELFPARPGDKTGPILSETVKLIATYFLLGVRNYISVQHIATVNKNGFHFPGISRMSLLSTTPRLALKPIWLPVKRVS